MTPSRSAGANASIGPITNSGRIIGNVEIDNQANVTINGGTGKTYGVWTGGTITVGDGNLVFAGGNTAISDNVDVHDGTGTVFNDDPLTIAAPITITGDFDQSSSGELDFAIADNIAGQYGSLTVTGQTTLDGVLGIDLTDGFRLASGDTFDLVASEGALSVGLDGLSVDGVACSAESADVWLCHNVGFYLNLDVAAGATGSIALSASGVAEPATWAMLGAGFLSVAGLAMRRRRSLA